MDKLIAFKWFFNKVSSGIDVTRSYSYWSNTNIDRGSLFVIFIIFTSVDKQKRRWDR